MSGVAGDTAKLFVKDCEIKADMPYVQGSNLVEGRGAGGDEIKLPSQTLQFPPPPQKKIKKYLNNLSKV